MCIASVRIRIFYARMKKMFIFENFCSKVLTIIHNSLKRKEGTNYEKNTQKYHAIEYGWSPQRLFLYNR